MRLINTSTLELKQFVGAQVPAYAILSHTWEEHELTFQDLANPQLASQKRGFAKVKETCRLARQTGIDYAWVDTCCIDKTSSAELSEAINSMFRWYASAAVCYAYLADLKAEDPVDTADPTSQFARCRWFTRGWTLQELIAPITVEFYDQEWTLRGTKATLSRAISTLTRIDKEVLCDSAVLFGLPIARRLSWAAHRQTTRVEDAAYSLLGICDVNMPMLYGEGEAAFIRLQEEIVKETNDMTLFAWETTANNQSGPLQHHGLFANSPADFAYSHDIMQGLDLMFNEEFSMTNKGLRIRTKLGCGPFGDPILSLNCYRQRDSMKKVGVLLAYVGGGTYIRSNPEHLLVGREWKDQHDTGERTIYIRKCIGQALSTQVKQINRPPTIRCRHGFGRLVDRIPGSIEGIPECRWDGQNCSFQTRGLSHFAGLLTLPKSPNCGFRYVVCGMSDNSPPWAAFLDETRQDEITPVTWDESLIYDLPKDMILSEKTVYDGPELRRLSISISLDEGTDETEPMYCIDISEVTSTTDLFREVGRWIE